MQSIIIYRSVHHKNTKKIAETIAKVLRAKLITPDKVNIVEIQKSDIIGFGSGIYFGRFHKTILELIEKLPKLKKKAFIFSTCGRNDGFLNRAHHSLKRKLEEKGFTVIGEFSCLGLDTVGPLRLFGGINKGRPNESDLEQAIDFSIRLKKKL